MTASGPEFNDVEHPLITQLQQAGWDYLEGDIEVPDFTERERFQDTLLEGRLEAAIRRINVDDSGTCWLEDAQVRQAVSALQRLPGHSLVETNEHATEILMKGIHVEGPDGKQRAVRYVDFEDPEKNDFLVINQFRVDPPRSRGDEGFIIPDVVLFVNGVPLVVVECKSPAAREPIASAIDQLRRYANQREEVSEPEGAERLFWTNQFTVATSFDKAYVGTFTAGYKHYMAWRETSPYSTEEVREKLGVDHLSQQQKLVESILRPERLLDVVRNFTLFLTVSGRRVKIVTRYQQYRAVHEAIERLQTGQTRAQNGEMDQRGGLVWHTQGSGKSLTMVFLVRKMRTLPELRRFKIVIVTDRIDLEDQLSETAQLTGDHLEKADTAAELQDLLKESGAGLVFTTIQKFQIRNDEGEVVGEREMDPFPRLNESEDILVLVDEAHRSHTSRLHANLMRALPNCAKIGFTGTPILKKEMHRTTSIFGPLLDTYTIVQSQKDGSTVPILYEGRQAYAFVEDAEDLDELFDRLFSDYSDEDREKIKQRYGNKRQVLEATELIKEKARDILLHYVTDILPNEMKAQVVAVSRRAAVRYQGALTEARNELVMRLEDQRASLEAMTEDDIEALPPQEQLLPRALPYLEDVRKLEFATVISGVQNDPEGWKRWTNKGRQANYSNRFKKPFRDDPLCMLVVNSMFLTGFDAPVEQALYLDRGAKEHELLQAIARVNRPYPSKDHGLVVDYYGVAHYLKEALEIYTRDQVEGTWASIQDELPRLEQRHQRAITFFSSHDVDVDEEEACVQLLEDERLRAQFKARLAAFLESLDTVLPRPEALPYVRDAKKLGSILQRTENRYRDEELEIVDAGEKVRHLIDDHIKAQGIEPKFAPIDILDAEFDDHVRSQAGKEAQAAEMEHAVRYHIRKQLAKDPVYYRSLSERLEEILEDFEGNWDALIEALREFIDVVRAGRPVDDTGLDPETEAPFFSVIQQALDKDELTDEEKVEIAEITVEMVEKISEDVNRPDFWRNRIAQGQLRNDIVRFLDSKHLMPLDKIRAVADQVLQLAREHHTRLVS